MNKKLLTISTVVIIILSLVCVFLIFNKESKNIQNGNEVKEESSKNNKGRKEYYISDVNKIKILKNEKNTSLDESNYYLYKFVEEIGNMEIENYDFFDDTQIFVDFIEKSIQNLKEVMEGYLIIIPDEKVRIAKGYFDFEKPEEETIVASYHASNYVFIFIMNRNLEMNILMPNNFKPNFNFENKPLKISDDLQFFEEKEILDGSGGWFWYTINLYRISDINLLPVAKIITNQTVEDKKPKGYIEPTGSYDYKGYLSSRKYYIDIDKDNVKEIIFTNFKEPSEPSENDVNFKKFMGNTIYKWNSEEKVFKEFKEADEFLYRATEFVDNDQAFEFWTEAYCPKSKVEPQYNFKIPEGYRMLSCIGGEKGSHGGCSSCVMSKIMLQKIN